MPESTSSSGKKGMRINKGLITAIGCLVVSLVFLYCSRTYPNLDADFMVVSAAMIPTIFSVIAVVMSVLLLVKAIVKPEFTEPLTELQKRGLIRGLLAIADCLVYVLLFKPLGYILSSMLAVFAMMLIFGNRKWWLMVLISVVLPILLYFAFHGLLQTNLPVGILTFLK